MLWADPISVKDNDKKFMDQSILIERLLFVQRLPVPTTRFSYIDTPVSHSVPLLNTVSLQKSYDNPQSSPPVAIAKIVTRSK